MRETELVDYVPEVEDKQTDPAPAQEDIQPEQEKEETIEVPEDKEDVDKPQEQPEEGQPTVVPESEKATDPSVESETSPEEVYRELSQESGVDIKSYDDVVNKLKELKSLTEDPYKGISPLLKEAIKAEQQGLDPSRFIQLSSLDYDKMDSRRALFEQFINKNADLYKSNPAFAEKKFEKDFNARYGIINKKVDPDNMDESEVRTLQEEQQFAKDSLDYDASVAKRELNELKQRAITPEPSQQPAPLTQEQIDKMKKEVEAEAQKIVDGFDSLEVPFGKENINVQLDVKQKAEVKQGLVDPLSFLAKHLGIDAGSEKIDKEKFASVAAWILAYPNVADIVGKLAVEWDNKKVVNKLENPKQKTSPNRQPTENIREKPEYFR